MAYFGKMGSRESRRTVPESHPLYVVNRSAAVRPRGRDEQLRTDQYDQGPQGTPLIDDARRYDPSLSGGVRKRFREVLTRRPSEPVKTSVGRRKRLPHKECKPLR